MQIAFWSSVLQRTIACDRVWSNCTPRFWAWTSNCTRYTVFWWSVSKYFCMVRSLAWPSRIEFLPCFDHRPSGSLQWKTPIACLCLDRETCCEGKAWDQCPLLIIECPISLICSCTNLDRTVLGDDKTLWSHHCDMIHQFDDIMQDCKAKFDVTSCNVPELID